MLRNCNTTHDEHRMSRQRPNVLLIIAEQLRGDMPGYAGRRDAETPFLDALAQRSAAFHAHFTVHGKCVPARAALYSGRYAHCGGHRTLGIELHAHEPSLAKILKEHGYHTILTFKNHTVDTRILREQFDEHWRAGMNGEKGISVFDYRSETTSHPRALGNKYADNYLFGRLNFDERQHQDYLATERAAAFIRSCKPGDAPFFLNLNFDFTHTPYGIMEPYYSRFMRKPLQVIPGDPGHGKPAFMQRLSELHGFARLDEHDRRELLACYLGMASYVDARVADVYRALEESGQLEDTIIVFTSDHGDFTGQYGVPEKWDTALYDCILRVPLIIQYGRQVQAARFDVLTESIDVAPTILELAGIPAPYGLQGRSLCGLLRGETGGHREYVFAEGGHEKELLEVTTHHNAYRDMVVGYQHKERLRTEMPDALRKAKMIRTARYKLVYRIKDRHELYDVAADPHEMNNLYGSAGYDAITVELQTRLLEHLIETEENLPFDADPIA